MLNNELHQSVNAGELERRDARRSGERMLGRVIACNGSHATITATAHQGETELSELWSVGRLISIAVGENRIVALSYAMQTESRRWREDGATEFHVEVELLGEVRRSPGGRDEFSRGISAYPYLGAIAHRIRATDLMRVYDTGKSDTCVVGRLSQDESIDAAIHIPSMLQKHFAILGSTGVGKSTAVSLLLHQAIAADPKLRVLILDPHNEFAAAFQDVAVVIDTDTLDLPFWLMRLEEFTEVVFRGRPAVPEEVDFLRDLIPEAKRAFRGNDSALMRRGNEKSSITADTPVPYRMADLLALIDERIGRLEGRNEKPLLRSLKLRVLAAINDPRYHFMFSNNTINDTITETIAHIFRIPGDDRPIATFQLAGIPSEVVNSVASILCRMAFELALWSNGAIHMLVVCEEAHRYVPADASRGFLPTRQAISRIAKEGRKYGVSLGVITQRPGELDSTILSQCSTLFAMRLANDHDQDIIKSAIPNSSLSTTSFLSALGNGEAIAFGEAMPVPMRMRFSRVRDQELPKANGVVEKDSDDTPDTVDLRSVVARMRNAAADFITPAAQETDESSDHDDAAHGYDDRQRPAPPTELPAERWRRDGAADVNIAATAAPRERISERLGERAPMLDRFSEPRRTAGPAPAAAYGERAAIGGQTGQASQSLLRREAGGSLRESLLKKPLSSLYERD